MQVNEQCQESILQNSLAFHCCALIMYTLGCVYTPRFWWGLTRRRSKESIGFTQELNIESAVIILLQLSSRGDCKGPLMLITCDILSSLSFVYSYYCYKEDSRNGIRFSAFLQAFTNLTLSDCLLRHRTPDWLVDSAEPRMLPQLLRYNCCCCCCCADSKIASG